MEKKNRYLLYSIFYASLLLVAIGIYTYGYNPPTCNPPGCNLPAPINAGPNSQTKEGSLTIGGNLTTGSFTMTAGAGANKVLTTDASGIATWQIPAGGGEAIPVGVIVMWSGTLATIPTGWHLCDGVDGTPDLRNRFIYGTAAGENPGNTGGATTHAHTYNTVIAHTHTGTTVSAGAHTHAVVETAHKHSLGTVYVNYPGNYLCAGCSYSGLNPKDTLATVTGITINSAGAHTHTLTTASTGEASGTTAVGTHLPPYYKLAYIMKL